MEKQNNRNLLITGCLVFLSILSYLWLARLYPLVPSLADPRADWTTLTGNSTWNAFQYVAILLSVTLLYLGILKLLIKPGLPRTGSVLVIIGAWLISSLILMAVSPVMESHDIFDYIYRGRMMVEHAGNPLSQAPSVFNYSIPYYRYIAWITNVDTYGPLWEMASASVSAGVRQLAQWTGWWDTNVPVCPRSVESCRLLVVYISGYRLLAVALTGLSGWLISLIVRGRNPALAPLALGAWFCNPMVLIASAVGGHNDALMLALFFLACLLLLRKNPFAGLLVILLAAHIKLTSLVWLPVFVAWIFWKWGWKFTLRTIFASAAVGVLISWLLYTPYGGWGTLRGLMHERTLYLANSIWKPLKYISEHYWHWSSRIAHFISVDLPSLLFVAAAVLSILWLFNLRPPRWKQKIVPPGDMATRLCVALEVISLLYVTVGTFWFQPWYLLWAIAPAVLLAERRLFRIAFPWAVFGALASIMVSKFLIPAMNLSIQQVWIEFAGVGMTWGPFLVAFALSRRTLSATIRSLDQDPDPHNHFTLRTSN